MENNKEEVRTHTSLGLGYTNETLDLPLQRQRSHSLYEAKLINIRKNLIERHRDVRNKLAQDIVSEQFEHHGAIDDHSTDTGEHPGQTEIFAEIETSDERMRSTYWGFELLFKTGAIDAATHIYVIWLAIVSAAFCYNIWTITLREAFPQFSEGSSLMYWLIMDYFCDIIYLLDIVLIKSRIMYHNEDGLMVIDRPSTSRHYFASTGFKLDLIALTPLDILYAVPELGVRPFLRVFRLIKVRSFWEFFDRVNSLLDSPDVLRILKILVYILLVVHLYTCCYYAISDYIGIGTGNFAYEGEETWPFTYARCYYIAFKIATSINSDKVLSTTNERLFMIGAWLVATFVVVVLLAQIREIFFELTREEEEFTRLVHTAVSYLRRYNCPPELEGKVRSWFMYTRSTQKVLEMQKVLSYLPRHIQAALALEINYKTLSKVTLFANCDRTVLTDLVVKLKPVLYLPGDFICKKGEIGKEMFIIVKGQAEVVGPEGQIFVTLSAGAVFGEISLLAVGGANRRTANVRSKGYSNLFTLSKDDFEEIMQHYPLIYDRLKKRAAETLAKSAKPPSPPPQPPAADSEKPINKKQYVSMEAGAMFTTEDVAAAAPPRSHTPKLLQLIRHILPNLPSLRRLFRVEPIDSPEAPADIGTGESIEEEIARLYWSSPSSDEFYVRSDSEQKMWDNPAAVMVTFSSTTTGSDSPSDSITAFTTGFTSEDDWTSVTDMKTVDSPSGYPPFQGKRK